MTALEEPLASSIVLAARVCIAMVFLVSGIHKAAFYGKAKAEFDDASVPAVPTLLPLTIALHLLGSLALISGIYAREFALALAVFTAIATLRVHCFWRMSGSERLNQSRIALAHLALIGGLMLLFASGPGQLVVRF